MKVRCISASGDTIDNPMAKAHFISNADSPDPEFAKGAEYPVFGVILRDRFVWYLLCAHVDCEYPTPQFGQLFEVVDNRIPAHWVMRVVSGNFRGPSLLPAAWSGDPMFLERLIDGVPASVDLFERLRAEAWAQ